ncbi:MAG: hypothetical protein M1827_005522 [Pycnora praestabilis]|nr:MAG: hypothetical protein M1827_005522 [Pycnora praestabilis]
MQCDTCERILTLKLPFHCTTCARNALYTLRLENARTLLQKESLGREVEEACGIPGSTGNARSESGSKDTPAGKATSGWSVAQNLALKEQSLERTQDIRARAVELREELKASRADIAERNIAFAQRRSDAASATHDLAPRRAATLETLDKGIKRTEQRWNAMHVKTAESRDFLCREAANLYGLRQRRRKKNGLLKEDYIIGGVGIVDLRDLNNASPAQITTSLTSLAHLLVLTSHYLLLRLPAEITLPHRDYPLATIFSPAASYAAREVPFPGSTASQSLNASPSASRTEDLRPLPRPRPLYLDKPVPVLAKDDPAAYSLLVEGVTLLAWNIAWVCHTQGISIGASTWEDVCPLGRNLWQLLVATPQMPSLPRIPSRNDVSTKSIATKDKRTSSPRPTAIKQKPMLGHFSHGTAHSFLGGAEASEHMRGWKLQGHIKIVDKLKSALLGELAGAEWEVLDEKEWEQDGETKQDEEAVLIGGKERKEGGSIDEDRGMMSRMSTGGGETTVYQDVPEDGEEKGKGTSGWTKLKPR